jgi:hypothetical protein
MGTEDYVETVVFVASQGECIGEYVAACATNECGYFGMSLR